MTTIIHKNVLSTYLSDWRNKIEYLPRVGEPKGPVSGYEKIFNAISSGQRDIETLLRMLDERLLLLENRPSITIDNIQEMDFTQDAEAIVLLKALYVQVRMYLDGITGVIRFFYGQNSLPMSFSDLLKKVGTAQIPHDLSKVLSLASEWFPVFKKTRDDLVHHYEDFLLLVYGKEEKKVIHHASLSKRDGIKAFDYGSIRDNLGQLLKNVQAFIDNLLDALDGRFRVCYGYVQSESSRTETIAEGGHLLYWASKYGGYRHRALRVQG